jgi:hypothetical protein
MNALVIIGICSIVLNTIAADMFIIVLIELKNRR